MQDIKQFWKSHLKFVWGTSSNFKVFLLVQQGHWVRGKGSQERTSHFMVGSRFTLYIWCAKVGRLLLFEYMSLGHFYPMSERGKKMYQIKMVRKPFSCILFVHFFQGWPWTIFFFVIVTPLLTMAEWTDQNLTSGCWTKIPKTLETDIWIFLTVI